MTATYAGPQNTVALLIGQKGALATLTRKVPGTFDPVTQVDTGATTTTETFNVVALPPGPDARFRVGSLENRNALEFYFSLKGRTLIPQPGDVVRWDGRDYALFWSQTYDPAGDGPIMTLAYGE